MINFCKNLTCPASQSLLAFQRGETQREENEFIGRHLAACEFCAAEVEFYARYPQSEEAVPPCDETQIPAPLYQLAEALLTNQQKNFNILDKLLADNERLTLKKA